MDEKNSNESISRVTTEFCNLLTTSAEVTQNLCQTTTTTTTTKLPTTPSEIWEFGGDGNYSCLADVPENGTGSICKTINVDNYTVIDLIFAIEFSREPNYLQG